MKQLCRGGSWRYPVCFLTNGGGVLEARKAQQLSQWLDVPVQENQVVLSHTPMRALAARLAEQCVLVSGRHDVINVATSYGFLPEGLCPIRDLGWASEHEPIAAVLVMADPEGKHWYQDLQLLTDVITGHGVPARQQPVPGSKPVEVYFSNPDLVWAAEYSRPRFGQGAFSTALDALHRQLTGSPLPNARWFGKPNPEPYRVAEQLLAGDVFSTIFAVGDNPAADIRGANNAGQPWVSVLVCTGVYQGEGNSEADPAHIVVTDVLAAVQAGLHRARSSRWHSMR
eukprot:gene6312-6547_t